MFKRFLHSRYGLLLSFQLTFLALSALLRIGLYFASLGSISFSFLNLLKVFGMGLYYDFGVSVFFVLFYSLYLLIFPSRWVGSIVDRVLTFFILGMMLFISLFGIFAEVPFWEEFNTRFNFIAVDYLIYTYEVVENINQSYPIPLIVLVLLTVIGLIIYLFYRWKVIRAVFSQKTPFLLRIGITGAYILITLFYAACVNNKQAEWSENTYENELSKNGIYSLFAAYRSNELNYNQFYPKMDEKQAYAIVKKALTQPSDSLIGTSYDDIRRMVNYKNDSAEVHPNIIQITVESLSADFLGVFGNEEHLTPNLDSLANNSVLFTNLYATGTRTVRGMEALTLSVPPTPGNSIVRRPDNHNIFSIADVLKERNYTLKFIYGGDGYFDNMSNFFGGQGFDIVDRDRGNPIPDGIDTKRYSIEDKDVTFENAWGIADEDIFNQSLKYADIDAKTGKPFYQFIMTTSNHRPYSFPEGKIDLPAGSRNSAVKYTDYAIGKFIRDASQKPWFKNTLFVIVADHCASSAGKWEINISKHHIPAIICNAGKVMKIDQLCSQIDLLPTLFAMLNWKYVSQFYGLNVLEMNAQTGRALVGNYRTLGMLREDVFTQINDKKMIQQFKWAGENLSDLLQPVDSLQKETVALYQTASERFSNGKMKNGYFK